MWNHDSGRIIENAELGGIGGQDVAPGLVLAI